MATIIGTNGPDVLNGTNAADTIRGLDGNDTLNGGAGADNMDGGDKNDTYYVDNVGDVAAETNNTATGGVDLVYSSVTHTLGNAIENLTLTGIVAINGTGNAIDNTITGNSGNNVLSGLAGNDKLSGGAGSDTLLGGAGTDTLDGGTGADAMNGGDQNDIYYVDNLGDTAAETNSTATGGVDLVYSSVTHTLGNAIENLTLTGATAINGTGNANNNILTGNGGNNVLSGLAGNDKLSGGAGNDTLLGGAGTDTLDGGTGADAMNGGDQNDIYYVDNVGDTTVETNNTATGGVDLVYSSVTHTIGNAIENLTLTGATAINGTGNANNNVITGNSANNVLSGLAGNDTLNGAGGNDTLDGGTGADSMNGGDQNDIYYVDNVGDVAAETNNTTTGGVDLIYSSVTHTVGNAIENLTLTGAATINGTGNANNNVITGNSANNALSGLDGNDSLYGSAGNDALLGGNGNDVLDGGAGADNMNGGDQNDTYYVDDAGDIAAETNNTAAGGVDIVYAAVTHTLSSALENLTLTGTAAISGYGNANANVITGNSANNYLSAGDGNDTLNGGLGDDSLHGGTGADNMNGGGGNDLYQVDNAGDIATETSNDAAGGIDHVVSTVTYSLGFGMERLTLTGSAAINGTGNENDNMMTGNAANNVLTGLDGNDTLNGFTGNDTLLGGNGNDVLDGGAGVDNMNGGDNDDTYYVDDVGDTASENYNDVLGGVDTVISSVSHTLGHGIENLTIKVTGVTSVETVFTGTGNENANIIIGDGTRNALFGLDGNDTLYGGNGNDGLHGGNDNDSLYGDNGVDALYGDDGSDSLDGGDGNDGLSGGNGNDSLHGGNGNDILDGGTGADTMNGGDNDDIYYVDNWGDVVAESYNDALGGQDSVYSSVTHWLGDGIENLTLTGTAAINGYGNGNGNTIVGNDTYNTLTGGDGNDTLTGNGGDDVLDGGNDSDTLDGGDGNDLVDGGNGNDTLTGGNGKDTMWGGAGADTMNGGDGDDIYSVDDAGDTVFESYNDSIGGIDTVYASASHALGFGIENLLLDGSANISGYGNNNSNLILGNDGDNYIVAYDGNDTIYGGRGNDTVFTDPGNDVVDGGLGNDTLFGAWDGVEDQFCFTTELSSTANVDTIYNFELITDQIMLDNDIFTNLTHDIFGSKTGVLNMLDFFSGLGANGSAWLAPKGIYYDVTNGNLYYNPTSNGLFGAGVGDEVLFARIDNKPFFLSAGDFTLTE